MTIKELNGLKDIDTEIKQLNEQLEELKTEAQRVTPNIVTIKQINKKNGKEKIFIVPQSGSRSGNSDRMAKLTEAIISLEAEIEEMRTKRIEEKHRIMRYINSIGESQLRSIFIARFIEGYSWTKVALYIGGNNTGDSVRKQVFRKVSKND